MKYQQIPIRRLSRAGSALLRDGDWHPFSEVGDVQYRVVEQIVQRVRLEPGESEHILDLFALFPPLPSRLLATGFREELCFRNPHGAWTLCEHYTRPFDEWERLARLERGFGITLHRVQEGLLEYLVPLPGFSYNAVRHGLILLRAASALAVELQRLAREERSMSDQEMTGLLRTLVAMFEEEHPPLAKPKRTPGLPSLFDEENA